MVTASRMQNLMQIRKKSTYFVTKQFFRFSNVITFGALGVDCPCGRGIGVFSGEAPGGAGLLRNIGLCLEHLVLVCMQYWRSLLGRVDKRVPLHRRLSTSQNVKCNSASPGLSGPPKSQTDYGKRTTRLH